jgi:hypothetical protein
MSLFRPIHWYHSRDDLFWPVGPLITLSDESVAKFYSQTTEKEPDAHWFEVDWLTESLCTYISKHILAHFLHNT